MRRFPSWLVFFIGLALSTAALADDPAAEIPANPTEAQTGKSVEKTGCAPLAAVSVEAKPVRLPTYTEDWDRLSEFTRSDRVVISQADFWVSRRRFVFWDIGLFSALGGGVAAVATFERLETDHWTKATKWSLAGGLSVAIVSLVVAWAISPDRNDLLSVTNQWNLRHPDQPLAP